MIYFFLIAGAVLITYLFMTDWSAKDNEIHWITFDVPERQRIYHFPNRTLSLTGVKRIEIRPSGKHRVETVDGRKVFVNPT